MSTNEARLREALADIAERAKRARQILTTDGGNWGMLDTSKAEELLAAQPHETAPAAFDARAWAYAIETPGGDIHDGEYAIFSDEQSAIDHAQELSDDLNEDEPQFKAVPLYHAAGQAAAPATAQLTWQQVRDAVISAEKLLTASDEEYFTAVVNVLRQAAPASAPPTLSTASAEHIHAHPEHAWERTGIPAIAAPDAPTAGKGGYDTPIHCVACGKVIGSSCETEGCPYNPSPARPSGTSAGEEGK